jgi:hypothetical protein
MSSDNVTPIRAGVEAPQSATPPANPPRRKRRRGLSERKLVEDRLEEQRQRIFQVDAIISVVAKVLDDEGEQNDERGEQPCWWSLTAAQELLQNIASQLEPEVCLRSGKETRS